MREKILHRVWLYWGGECEMLVHFVAHSDDFSWAVGPAPSGPRTTRRSSLHFRLRLPRSEISGLEVAAGLRARRARCSQKLRALDRNFARALCPSRPVREHEHD